MKSSFFTLILFLAVSLSAQGQEYSNYIGSVAFDITPGMTCDEYFFGANAKIEYKHSLTSNFYVLPGASLFYEQHTCDCLAATGPNQSNYSFATGIGVSAFIGYSIPISDITNWDLYTGPDSRFNVIARKSSNGFTFNNVGDENFCRWVALRWAIGAGFNYKRVTIRAEYALGLTAYDDNDTQGHILTTRIAYRF